MSNDGQATCQVLADHTVDVDPGSKYGFSFWTCAAHHEAALDQAEKENLDSVIWTSDTQSSQHACGWPLGAPE